MPNIASAIKRVRQTEKRTARNRFLKDRIKSCRRGLAKAVASGDSDAIQKALAAVFSATDKAVKKGAIHKNAAGRIKSRSAELLKKEAA